MRFMIRLFVFGFIALAVLPAVAPAEYRSLAADTDNPDTPTVAAFASALGQMAVDLGDICDRQPAMCDTGRDFITYAGEKAREGLVIAYAMFRHGHPSMHEAPEQGSPWLEDSAVDAG